LLVSHRRLQRGVGRCNFVNASNFLNASALVDADDLVGANHFVNANCKRRVVARAPSDAFSPGSV